MFFLHILNRFSVYLNIKQRWILHISACLSVLALLVSHVLNDIHLWMLVVIATTILCFAKHPGLLHPNVYMGCKLAAQRQLNVS